MLNKNKLLTPEASQEGPKGRPKLTNKSLKDNHQQHVKNTSKDTSEKLPKDLKEERLWVDKRSHGNQSADMRQTLAGVCENDIREAARYPNNIKKPFRVHLFCSSNKIIQTYAKKLPQGHPKEFKTPQEPLKGRPRTTFKTQSNTYSIFVCFWRQNHTARNVRAWPMGR